MRRLGIIALSVLIALSSFLWIGHDQATVYAKEELVKVEVANADFEQVNEDHTFPGWTARIAGQEDGLFIGAVPETNAQFVKTGSQSLKLEDRSDKRSMEFVSNRIAIEGGQTYRLTTELYVAEKSVRIYLKYYDESGKVVGDVNVLADTPKVWSAAVLELEAPSAAKTAEIWFYKGLAAKDTLCYVDSVKLEKVVVKKADMVIPYEAEPVNLGPAVITGLSQIATFGAENGRLVHYIAAVGSPVHFIVADALTGEILRDLEIRELGAGDVVWGMDIGSDGNVYFASKGRLYRYKPAGQAIEDLGENPTGNKTMYDVKASADGKIYGSTFSTTIGARVFEYEIASGEFKDLGVIKAGQTYARGLGVTDKYVYIGVGEMLHLMRYNRETKEMTEVEIPGYTGTKKTLSEINVFGNRLFVYAGEDVHVLKNEADNYEYVQTFKFQSKIAPPSEAEPDLVYFKRDTEFFQYNLLTDEITPVTSFENPLPRSAFKTHVWLTPATGEFAGKRVLFSMAAYGETMIYDPETGAHSQHLVNIPGEGTVINSLKYKKGLLFMGGYQRGMSVYDTKSNQVIHHFPTFPQSENIGFLGDAVYFGVYPSAVLYRLDLSQEIHFNEFGVGNPGLMAEIQGQNRPYIMEEGDGRLFVGSFNSGSNFQGAFSILQEKKDEQGNGIAVEAEVFTDVVKDQSVLGLAYADGMLYGSTTIYSGAGSLNPPPKQEQATVFKFDPETKQVVASMTPAIEGLTGKPYIIGDLSVGPDGLIWGVLDAIKGTDKNVPAGYDGAVFALDPDTLELVKGKVIGTTPRTTSKYRPYVIEWGPDGLMYTTIGRKLMAIDPESLDFKQLVPSTTVDVMTMADNGDIYYSIGDTRLYKLKSTFDGGVDPENPENPENPGNPGNPENPENPGNPGSGEIPAADPTQRKLEEADWKVDNGRVRVELANETNKLLIPVSLIGDDAANQVLVVSQGELQLEIPLALAENLGSASVLSIKLDVLDAEARAKLISGTPYTDGGVGFTLQLLADDLELTLDGAAVGLKVNRNDAVLYSIDAEGQLTFVGDKTSGAAGAAKVSRLGTFLSLQYDMPFADVAAEHWGHEAIEYLAARQIVDGMSDTEFGTEQSLTRAQFTALLVRLFDLHTARESKPFGDIAPDAWYASEVQIAAALGIVDGMSDTEFKPDVHITREQMAVMLVRAHEQAAGKVLERADSVPFADAGQMSDWATDAVKAVVGAGWMQGYPDNAFAPRSEATRAESAMLLYNFLNR